MSQKGGTNKLSIDLRTRERFTSTMDKELKKRLKSLSEATRIPQTRLLDEAIEDLIAKYKEKGFEIKRSQ